MTTGFTLMTVAQQEEYYERILEMFEDHTGDDRAALKFAAACIEFYLDKSAKSVPHASVSGGTQPDDPQDSK